MIRWFRETGWRHLIGGLMLLVVMTPLAYILSAALSEGGTLTGSNELFRSISLANFQELLAGERVPYVTWWLNTMKVAAGATIGSVAVSAMAAYAFSRFRFRGRRQGLAAILLIQMFPAVLGLVALFLLLDWIGGIFPGIGLDTHPGLILVYLGGSLGVVTWLITGNFNTIPRELDEAARIDGAGHVRIFLVVVLPLAAPMLVVVALLTFMLTVGEFAVANVVLNDRDVLTAAVGLTDLATGTDGRNANWGLFAAGAVLLAAPVLVLFFAGQRWIVGGLTSGSVK